MIFDKWLNESNGFSVVPVWIDRAIQTKNPHLSVGVANSRLYEAKSLDKMLNTMPMAEKIYTEVN